MFVSQLTHVQKNALIRLFTFIARSDGKLDRDEWHYLNRFCDEHGLTYDINEEKALSELCQPFDSHQVKMIALVELVKMALSDCELAVNEQLLIGEIAEVMGIAEDTIKALEDWAVAGANWSKQGKQFCQLGD